MLPDQMRRPAQVSQKRPVLDLDNRADDSEEVENNQSRDDQRDRPDDDEHYHEQVRPDETAPRQGPGYMPDRGALGSVLGLAHEPAQESRQEHLPQDGHAGRSRAGVFRA